MAQTKDDMLKFAAIASGAANMLKFAAIASGAANYDLSSSHLHRLARILRQAYLHMVEWEKEAGHA